MVVGLGIDLVERDRVGAALERWGERLVAKLMDPPEAAALPVEAAERAYAIALAIAGKESVSKAIGTGWTRGVRWRDVVIRRSPPAATLLGAALRYARRLGSEGEGALSLEVRGNLVLGEFRLFVMEPWRRNQYVTVATVFVVFAGFAFVLPFLPLYVRELGVVGDDRVALWSGVLIGIGPLLAGLLAPAWGRLADRHGQKAIALVALGAYVVLLALSAAARDVYDLLATRVALGLFGGIGPLSLAMATSQGPRAETGKAVGLIEAAKILSAAIGPLAGGAAASSLGSRRTFVAAALLCVVPFLLVALLYREAPRASGPSRAPLPGLSLRALLRLPEMGWLLLVLFFVNFIGRSYTPILPLHLRTLGVSDAGLAFSTGLLISIYSIAAAFSATTLGRVCRDTAPRGLLIASLLGGALTVLPMALVPRFELLLLFAVLLGLASGGALTLCYTIGGLSVPSESRTAAFGYFSAAALFGGAVSPSVAGLLAHWNLRAIYHVNALLFVVLAGLLALRRAGSARA